MDSALDFSEIITGHLVKRKRGLKIRKIEFFVEIMIVKKEKGDLYCKEE